MIFVDFIIFFFFFNDTATTEIYTLSLHDALPILVEPAGAQPLEDGPKAMRPRPRSEEHTSELQSHVNLVCRLLLEKKKKPIYFFCHGIPERCFTIRGHSFPICARCTGLLICVAAGFLFFFFNDTATTEIYTLSLHDALPI